MMISNPKPERFLLPFAQALPASISEWIGENIIILLQNSASTVASAAALVG